MQDDEPQGVGFREEQEAVYSWAISSFGQGPNELARLIPTIWSLGHGRVAARSLDRLYRKGRLTVPDMPDYETVKVVIKLDDRTYSEEFMKVWGLKRESGSVSFFHYNGIRVTWTKYTLSTDREPKSRLRVTKTRNAKDPELLKSEAIEESNVK